MLFSTPAQFLVLGLVLVGGWLLGLASHPGGKKWKARYQAERDAHAAHRREVETRADTARTRVAELERENGRIAELERENARLTAVEQDHARLAQAAPFTASTIRPVAAASSATAASAARPAYPASEKRGWFDFGPRPVGR